MKEHTSKTIIDPISRILDHDNTALQKISYSRNDADRKMKEIAQLKREYQLKRSDLESRNKYYEAKRIESVIQAIDDLIMQLRTLWFFIPNK